MIKTRDDFSSSTIRKLRDRVSGRCSNPDHRVPTTGPTTDPTKINNIGKAAHITAAAPGGPRYNDSLTSDERRHINNGIWLCAICADKIDKDAETYSVELLQNWKRKAEAIAEFELGSELPSLKELQLFKNLVFKEPLKGSIPDAVRTVCQLAESEFEKLDPRFAVEVGFSAGVVSCTMNAREAVDLTLSVQPQHSEAFQKKYSALRDHGINFDFPLEALKFSGSNIIERLSEQKGLFSIGTSLVKNASLHLKMKRQSEEKREYSRTIEGQITGGVKSYTFEGTIFGGLLKVVMVHEFSRKKIDFNFNSDLSIWEGRQLQMLPYLTQLREFYEFFTDSSGIDLSLDIEGNVVCSGHCSGQSSTHEQRQFSFYLSYLFYLQAICRLIGIQRTYTRQHDLAYEDVRLLHYVWQLAVEWPESTGTDLDTLTATLVPDSGKRKVLVNAINAVKPSAIRINMPFDKPINIMGEFLNLPDLSLTYTQAWIKKNNTKKPQKNAMAICIMPSPDCKVISIFLTSEQSAD